MSDISKIIGEWYIHNKRDLPWRNTKFPYFIWLSEIILQQTRVNQGLNYYLKFTDQYPDVQKLASAKLDDVLKLWQGLGYYTRARNMHATARMIVDQYGGIFPSSYRELLKLKGIGTYTAAAIASIAFSESVPVVDGNVYRILSRVFAEHTPVNTPEGKKVFRTLAEKILDHENPGMHNQAVMELGSLICRPKKPLCHDCPLAQVCKAKRSGLIPVLPVKMPGNPSRNRYFNYLVFSHHEKIYISKRITRDIWHSLYEFPLIETSGPLTVWQLVKLKEWDNIMDGNAFHIGSISGTYKHKLTHQNIFARFFNIVISGEAQYLEKQFIPVTRDALCKYAVPRLIERYLQDLK
ncbi:MAG: A/G-specific adenine glycosylase [Bacteroidales bacterium]|nr:A/G-specific adenine glycosylase [Bacteroidales bacterium]